MPLNPLLMEGKTILVTGASSGIGRETATLLSALGARIVLAGRDSTRLEETKSRLDGEGHVTQAFELADNEGIPNWLTEITRQVGPLDGLAHCAGVHQALPLRMLKAAKVEEILRINLTSAVMLVKAFRQKGCASTGGSVVLVSSVAGLAGQPGVSSYAASKAALIGFTRAAAMELAPEGLRVNAVAPGFVCTEMGESLRGKLTPDQFSKIEESHPLGLGTPLDVAQAIAYLLAPTGRWITGSTLVIDGGYTAQ